MRPVCGKYREGIVNDFLPLFRARLYRTDTHDEITRTPLSIGDVTFAAEDGEFFSRMRRGTVKVRFPMDDELREYIKDWQDTDDPETLQVEIEAAFPTHPNAQEIQFLGNPIKFPEPRTADAIEDDVILLCGDFTSSWGTAEGMLDPNGLPYKNYSAEELLTVLLDYTGTPRGHQRVSIPRLKQSDPFWSAINRPRPDRVDPERTYDNTARCRAVTPNEYNDVLYIGVNDEIYTFDPSVKIGEYSLLVKVRPYENITHPDIEPEYNIEYLEWDPTTGFLRGILGTTGTDLLEPWTHTKFQFTVAPAFVKWGRYAEILADGGAGGISVGDTVRVDISALPGMLASKNDVRIGYSNGEYIEELPRAISGNFVLFESQEDIAAGVDLDRTYWVFWNNPDAGAPPIYVPGAVVETYLYGDLLYLSQFGDDYITDGGDRFFLCDKGIAVRSKHLFYHNYPDEDPPGEIHNYWWEVASIGSPTVGDKDADIPKPYRPSGSELQYPLLKPFSRGSYKFVVFNRIPVGRYAEIRDETNGVYQLLGEITELSIDSGLYEYTVKYPAKKNFPAYDGVSMQYTYIYVYEPDIVPTPNIFLPRYAEVVIEYIRDELSDSEEHPVRVDRRSIRNGTGQQYFPQKVAELNDGGRVQLKPGYYSFSSVPDTDETIVSQVAPDPNIYQNKNEIPSPFKVIFPGVNPAYCLRKGLIVHQRLTNIYELPGDMELLYYGTPTRFSNNGNIFLYDDGDRVWIAWNAAVKTKYPGVYYTTANLGRVDFSGDLALPKLIYQDRSHTDYTTLPAYEIESYIVENGKHFGGRRRHKMNWIKTGLLITWAAPPQDTWKPSSWDGDLAFTVLVEGDRTELVEPGDYIRLGGTADGEPGGKEYVVSEVAAHTLFIDPDDPYALEGYTNILKMFTRISCIGIDQPVPTGGGDYPGAYEKQVEGEILGKYITISKGWDIRVEAFYYGGGAWTDIYTVLPSYSEPEEGEELDYAEEKAHGEDITVEYEDGWSASPRSLLERVFISPSTILPVVEDGLIELDVIDYTDNPGDMPDVPSRWQAFVKGKQGADFNQTYIYFNPALEGKKVRVNYSYYDTESVLKGFIRENDFIYFNETVKNKWLRIDLSDPTADPDRSYSPRIGDSGLYSNPVMLNGTIYAVVEPSFLIVQFSEGFSGYIDAEIGDEDTDLYEILGRLARACGAVAFCSFDDILFYPRQPRDNDGLITNITKCDVKATLPYKAVDVNYLNGRVRIGADNAKDAEIYSISCDYIQSKGHAEIIANQLSDLFLNIRRYYEVTVERYDTRDEPLDRKFIPAQFIPDDMNPGLKSVPIVLTETKYDKDGNAKYKGYEDKTYGASYLPAGAR